MDTIGMDTHPLVAPVTGTAPGVFTQLDPALRRARAKAIPVMTGFPPALVSQTTVKTPSCTRLANAHSPRDNYPYRAAFTRPDRPPETRP